MNTRFLAWLLLLLPLYVLAAEHSTGQADLSAYKELSQVRTEAIKESLQKDLQAQQVRFDMQDKRFEQQDKLLDSFSSRISDLSMFLTFFGLAAGLLGYFTVSSRAKNEARAAAAEWMEREGQKAIDAKLRELDSHIANEKEAATKKLSKLYGDAAADIAERQKQMSAIQKSIDFSIQEQTSLTDSDPISQLVEALKHKPEAEYGFDDWNARAHDAYAKGNFALGAEYWLQAARGGKGNGTQVAQSLFNAAFSLFKVNRNKEAIDVYDEVVSRYGNAPELALREQVSKALTNKGLALNQLKSHEEAIAVFDEAISRYGDAPEVSLREQVANALLYKCVALGQSGREEEAIRVSDEIVSGYGGAPETVFRDRVARALSVKNLALNRLKRYGEAVAVSDDIVLRYGGALEMALREQVARALLNKAAALRKLDRKEDAIAVSDEIVSRYGSAPEAELRIQVADALLSKCIALNELNRYEESMAVCDEMVARYGNAPEAELQLRVSRAFNSKGFALLCHAKSIWSEEAARISNLQAASTLFAQAEKTTDSKPMVWGNQAYAAFLLGQPESARPLLKQALQEGGEEFFLLEQTDLNIHPVPADTEFRILLEELWAEVKRDV